MDNKELRELYKKVAKEILPKLDEIAGICKENGIDRAHWMDANTNGYICFRLGEFEFMRFDQNGKLKIRCEEEV